VRVSFTEQKAAFGVGIWGKGRSIFHLVTSAFNCSPFIPLPPVKTLIVSTFDAVTHF